MVVTLVAIVDQIVNVALDAIVDQTVIVVLIANAVQAANVAQIVNVAPAKSGSIYNCRANYKNWYKRKKDLNARKE